MAITGAIFNSLIYGGVDSADYGVYITGDAVFNAPKRSVELVSVPGRNGSIEIDQGHFENIEVSYPAGMFGDDKTDFRERLSDFRNAIMAQKGYHKLSDTYHTDEYRMGIYVDGLEVDPTHYNEAGQFTLKFNCKPQRWLTSGEDPIDVMEWGETETLSGEIVTFEAEDETVEIKSVSAEIAPTQDLHGYEKPWAGGNGKNKLPSHAEGPVSGAGLTLTFSADGTVTINNTATANAFFNTISSTTEDNKLYLPAGSYKVGCSQLTSAIGSDSWFGISKNATGGTWDAASNTRSGASDTFTVADGDYVFPRLRLANGQSFSNLKVEPIIYKATDTGTWEPYSNICPISGWTECEVNRTGKNLLRNNLYEAGSLSKLSWTKNSDESITVTASQNITQSVKIDVGSATLKAGTYVLNGISALDKSYIDLRVRKGSVTGSQIAVCNSANPSATFTLTEPTTIYFVIIVIANYTQGSTRVYPMLRRVEESDATYEPYNGNTYTIDLDGTRYGGTIDVTSGVMRVTKAIDDLGTLNWQMDSTFWTTSVTDIPTIASVGVASNIISDQYETKKSGYQSTYPNDDGIIYRGASNTTSKFIRVKDSRYSTTEDFKTAVSGSYIVYDLENPLTVQLTPTQIEALVGENNVWASTGDITVEYGMQPGYVTNPTLFDAQPLLYAEGSGKIEFNGYEIEIADIELGDVTLWERGTGKTTFGGQLYSRTIAPGLLNIGDNFTLGSLNCSYNDSYESYSVTFSNASATVTNSGIPGVTGSGQASIRNNGHQVYWSWNVNVPPIEFVFGTAKTVNETSALTANWSENGTAHTLTHNVTLSISYDGDSTVEITFGGVTFWMTTTLPACTGVSTVSLGGYNMYIDCDLGEAYYIEDGEVVSLNAYIDLGSDLPVLAPGINNITYDDSIDVLNVTPRWWKV